MTRVPTLRCLALTMAMSAPFLAYGQEVQEQVVQPAQDEMAELSRLEGEQSRTKPQQASLNLVEASILELRGAMLKRRTSPARLVRDYWSRIEAYEPTLNAYQYLNQDALEDARCLLADNPLGFVSPLWGIPVMLKDNIDVKGMPTTAGAVALEGNIAREDSFVAKKLRAAGAVIIGKGTLTEFANFISQAMPAGFSALGGFGFNPYDPRPDARFPDGRPLVSPGGSSSGPAIAVNASLIPVAVGTETSGSLLNPAWNNSIVAIKPTTGIVSRSGVVPITSDMDTPGPMARTVTDAALLLGVMTGYDRKDPATEICRRSKWACRSDYYKSLKKNGLKGARIAIISAYWGGPPAQMAVLENAIAVMKAQGATVDIVDGRDPAPPDATFPPCFSYGQPNCSTVMLYGFKRGVNQYLASTAVGDLTALRQFNLADPSTRIPYGQAWFNNADQMNTDQYSDDTARYLQDREREVTLTRETLDFVMNGTDGKAGTRDDYDAILFHSSRGANVAARAGYPSIELPAGYVPGVTIPQTGVTPNPAPLGFALTSRPYWETRLIELGYAYEQAAKVRVAPEFSSAPVAMTSEFERFSDWETSRTCRRRR